MWRQVWAWCAVPLVIGIVVITTTQNSPTLPFHLAIACELVTLGGLVFVLPTGSHAAQPRYLAWLTLDRLGLVPPLLFMRAIELNRPRLAIANLAGLIEIGSVVGGAV